MFETLRDRYEELSTAITSLLPELHMLREVKLSELNEVDQLIARIEGDTGQSKDRRRKRRRKNSRSDKATKQGKCASKSEILSIVSDRLRLDGVLSADKLKESVFKTLRERGRSLSMAGKLFQDCLKDPSLTEQSPGYFALTEPHGEASGMSEVK